MQTQLQRVLERTMTQGGTYSHSNDACVRWKERPETFTMEMVVEATAAEVGYTFLLSEPET